MKKHRNIKETKPGVFSRLKPEHQDAMNHMAAICAVFGYEMIATAIPYCPKCGDKKPEMEAVAVDEDAGSITFRCNTCRRSYIEDEHGTMTYKSVEQ